MSGGTVGCLLLASVGLGLAYARKRSAAGGAGDDRVVVANGAGINAAELKAKALEEERSRGAVKRDFGASIQGYEKRDIDHDGFGRAEGAANAYGNAYDNAYDNASNGSSGDFAFSASSVAAAAEAASVRPHQRRRYADTHEYARDEQSMDAGREYSAKQPRIAIAREEVPLDDDDAESLPTAEAYPGPMSSVYASRAVGSSATSRPLPSADGSTLRRHSGARDSWRNAVFNARGPRRKNTRTARQPGEGAPTAPSSPHRSARMSEQFSRMSTRFADLVARKAPPPPPPESPAPRAELVSGTYAVQEVPQMPLALYISTDSVGSPTPGRPRRNSRPLGSDAGYSDSPSSLRTASPMPTPPFRVGGPGAPVAPAIALPRSRASVTSRVFEDLREPSPDARRFASARARSVRTLPAPPNSPPPLPPREAAPRPPSPPPGMPVQRRMHAFKKPPPPPPPPRPPMDR